MPALVLSSHSPSPDPGPSLAWGLIQNPGQWLQPQPHAQSPRTMPVSSNLRPTTIPTLTLPVVLWVITVIKAPGPPLCVPAAVRAVQSVSPHAGLCAVWLITPSPRFATSDCTAQQGTVLFWVSLHPIHLLPLIASPRTQSQPWVVSCRTFPGSLACLLQNLPRSLGTSEMLPATLQPGLPHSRLQLWCSGSSELCPQISSSSKHRQCFSSSTAHA